MKALHHCLIWQKPVGSTGVVPGEDKCCFGMRVTGGGHSQEHSRTQRSPS